ncbi:DEAD/DEAH box helicase [Aeromicrobium sp. S22]|uniref:DEAD/DEAH box helicase n=1 Tax=Aeromicrobium sp. S22 TaxID=2662029 RepID=UPI001E32DE74|nr:DEAD/DEAH box helicase [Aeromicrobium sp. S22]
MQPESIAPQLLKTAWYLHGVASAVDAAEIFNPVRQRRAFQVSAHIFDLALSTPDASEHDQLTFAFAAQVGYRRAGLDPNASAIWRRVDNLLEDVSQEPLVPDRDGAEIELRLSYTFSPAFGVAARVGSGEPSSLSVSYRNFERMALRAGVAFLGLDFRRAGELIGRWRLDCRVMAETLGADDLFSTMFGPAEQVVKAVSDLMEFLRFGSRERIGSARTALRSVVDRSAGVGDHDARWVSAHLLQIVDGLEASSTWSVFPSDGPDALAQAFTMGSPPVLTLWPPQQELLTREGANPLDASTKRLLLSVPTSAGKTLLAQVIICEHLANRDGDICYITPLRSLGREMRQALATRLRILDKGLGTDLPDFSSMTIEEIFSMLGEPTGGAVEVMTPERLAHMLRRDPEAVLSRFSMFVVDEAHMMAQRGRGLLLETLLATLSTTDARLVLLSGVMGNAQQVATWLDDSRPEVLFSSDWRGPRRLHALLYSRRQTDKAVRAPRQSLKYPTKETTPLIGELKIRPAESQVRTLVTTEIGQSVRIVGSEGSKPGPGSTAFYRQCARVASILLKAGSLLMIVSQRAYARDAAKELAAQLEETPATAGLVEFLVERLGEEHPLIDCVRRGVGYHHAGLPVDVLDALEQAVREEQLRALVATTTLTDGVNLPVRTVLVSETRYEGQPPEQQLDAAQLLNAVGRSGRAGRETEGWIVLCINGSPRNSDFDLLRPADEDLRVASTLTTEGALEGLAAAEALIATSADSIFDLDAGEATDFVSYVWFVLSAQERLQQAGSGHDLARAVGSMLAFRQLSPDLRNRWLALAGAVERTYDTVSPASRRRWAIAGTTIGSARTVERIATDLATAALVATEAHRSAEPTGNLILDLDTTLTILEEAGVFQSLLGLQEAGKAWTFKLSPRARDVIEVPLIDSLRSWLAGSDMASLAALMLPTVNDASWRLEQTVDAVSETFEHFLSWTVGVVLEQANEILDESGHHLSFPPNLSYLIRYGVDTNQALELLVAGVRSRRLAYLVGQSAAQRDLSGPYVVDWLTDLHIEGWIELFQTSDREIEDLATRVRAGGSGLVRRLLEYGEGSVGFRDSAALSADDHGTVEIRRLNGRTPLEVWTVGDGAHRIGEIAARDHLDVLQLRASGLDVSAVVDDTGIRFSRERL